MTAFSFPSVLKPKKSSKLYMNNSGSFQASPFSGYTQSFGRFGSKLGLALSFNGLGYEKAQILEAFLLHLHGLEHSVKIHDHSHTSRGSMTGTPRVNGADQTGYVLSTDGWTPDITLYAGNQFNYVNPDGIPELKIITADTLVNGSGEADIPIWPDVHGSPADNAALDVSSPEGHFKLQGGTFTFDADPGDFRFVSFTLIEDFS